MTLKHRFPTSKLLLNFTGMSLLAIPLGVFGWFTVQRPPQTNLEMPLFQGVSYRREFYSTPRPVMMHIVAIDLAAPGIKAFVTPGMPTSRTPTPDHRELTARTTSEFLQEFKPQIAVNANFFFPFDENTPWNYYPHSGDRVNAVGQAISNGTVYSEAEPGWSALCLSPNQMAQIIPQGTCPAGTAQAVAGSGMVLEAGKPVVPKAGAADSNGVYSRTAVAIDASGKKLWLIAIDDKQWLYSEGVSLLELAEIARRLGAVSALNLDGGGSTTLVMATPAGTTVLNSPVHTKIPMRERSVANHLGFYALPLKN